MALIYAGGQWRNVSTTAKAQASGNPAIVQNNARGSSPAAVAAAVANTAPTPAPAPVSKPSGPPAGWQQSRGMLEDKFGGANNPVITLPAPSPPPPPPPPAAILPNFRPMVSNKNFKVAPSDIIQFDDSSVEIELIKDLLFEDIGATELANISRTDLIDGQNVIYAPIKNLPVIRRDFNPNNIVATGSNTDYFSRFAIDLSLRGVYDPYFDDQGNLVIEIETVGDDEEIQAQILTNGTITLVDDI